MKLRFLLFALFFILLPHASESQSMAIFMESGKEESEQKGEWLEEEREVESHSEISEVTNIAHGSSSGVATPVSYSFDIPQNLCFAGNIKKEVHWIILSKQPHYIRFCSLKLDC